MTDQLEEARKLRVETQQAAERVVANRDLTTEAKRRQIDDLFESATSEMEWLRGEYFDQFEGAREKARKKLFTPPSSDPERLATYRQALDRALDAAADNEKKPWRLAEVLELAELVGDEDQAHAAFVAAFKKGREDVVTAYLQDRADRRASFEAIDANDMEADIGRRFQLEMSFAMPEKPALPVG